MLHYKIPNFYYPLLEVCLFIYLVDQLKFIFMSGRIKHVWPHQLFDSREKSFIVMVMIESLSHLQYTWHKNKKLDHN